MQSAARFLVPSLLRLVARVYSVWRSPTTFPLGSTPPPASAILFVALCGMAAVPDAAQAQTTTAVEYYYAAWNMYFETAFPQEISALDGGAFGGVWKRTGQSFAVWSQSVPGSTPTCRFFSIAFAPKSSHFYTPYPAECEYVKTNPADVAAWEFENIAFYVQLGDPNTGQCAGNTAPVPLYRLYNNGMGGAPNHRYTTDLTIVNQMIALGWTPEGSGNPPIFACGPPSSTLEIQTNSLPPAVAGQTYVPQLAATATGGEPPYHFQLDSLANGAPPLGMSIDLNGYMTGTPSATYTSPVTFTFNVCVVDLAATIQCGPTSITVNPPAMPTGTMSWSIGDQCNNGAEVDYKFYDSADNLVWPSSSTHYFINYGQSSSLNLSCVSQSLVCIGAQSGSLSWGVGFNGGSGCPDCCGTCDGNTYAYTFGCGSPGTNYYANWFCTSSQCAQVMGGTQGTNGPFCSVASCNNWRQAFDLDSSCSTQPTYAPTPGGSQCFNYP